MSGEPILLIEDNAANAALILFLLTEGGYDVRVAVDARAALTEIENFRPWLILMDVQLPGMDGLELTRRLKADDRTREICIVALTAYAMKGDAQRARDAGCDDYITKPIDTRTFPGVVKTHLRRRVAAIRGTTEKEVEPDSAPMDPSARLRDGSARRG
jgi:two-component system cell cycle response regulator